MPAIYFVLLQELMRQASWNLCPQAIQYNTACYADPDITFNTLAGSSSSPMPDLPDGVWALVLKKDIFQKVRHMWQVQQVHCFNPNSW